MYVYRSTVVWKHFRAVMRARKVQNNRQQSPFRHLRKYLTTLITERQAMRMRTSATPGRGDWPRIGPWIGHWAEHGHVTERQFAVLHTAQW